MKGPLIVSLVALALSAVAVTSMLRGPEALEPDEGLSALPAPGPEVELLARVEALSEENSELRERLTKLELRPAAQKREPAMQGFATVEEVDVLRSELAALREELASPDMLPARPIEASPAFKDQVASTLTQLRKQERVDKVRSQLDRRLEHLEETMPKINEWLGLSAHQSNEMRSALLARYDRESELVRRWEAGEDPELLGEVKVADREAHRNDVRAFLTPDQLATYESRQSSGGK